MNVQIDLEFERTFYHVVEEYHSLDDARFMWTEGPNGCDCCRSEYLVATGDLPRALPCNPPGHPRVRLVAIRPFLVH